jgi:hypothetical protein
MESALACSGSILRRSARILYDKRQTQIDYLPAPSMLAGDCKRRELVRNRCGARDASGEKRMVYHVFLRRIQP